MTVICDCGIGNRLACISNHVKFNLAEILIWGAFMLIVMEKHYWDQDTQPDVLSVSPMETHKLKMDSRKIKRCQVIISLWFLALCPCISESLSHRISQINISYLLYQGSLYIMSRKILFQTCMTFPKCHKVWLVWPCSLCWDCLTNFIYLKVRSSQTLSFLMTFYVLF